MTKDEGMERIQSAFRRYREARLEDPFGGREYLEEIQAIVDMVDAPFLFKIPQPDGVPYQIKFLPKRLRMVDPKLSGLPLIGAGMHMPPSTDGPGTQGIVL